MRRTNNPAPGYDDAVRGGDGNPTPDEGTAAEQRGAASMQLGYGMGYRGRPDETRAKICGDGRITKDRGFRDNGDSRFVGRKVDVITGSGYRIRRAEIAGCQMTDPAVDIVARSDVMRREIFKADVLPQAGQQVRAGAPQVYVRDDLAHYSYPREIEFVDALPMTVAGQVVRRVLTRRAVAEQEVNP